MRYEDVETSRFSLILEQAMRVSQSVSKDGENARDWWVSTHEVAAHWKVPPKE